MEKASKIFFRFLKTAVGIAVSVLAVVATAITLFIQMTNLQWKLAILLAVGLSLCIAAIFLKTKDIYKLLIILSVAFFMRLIWTLNTDSVPVSDFLTMFDSAKGFLVGNKDAFKDYGYLARFPHMVPMTVYMMGIIKIFGANAPAAIRCISLILSVLSVYLIYVLSAYYIKRPRFRLFSVAIAAIYPPFIAYCSAFCTESIGIPLFLLSMILFHRAISSESKKAMRFLIAGAVLYLSNMFRVVGIIFIIAFVIFIIFFTKKQKTLSICTLIAGYFITALLSSSILIATDVIEQPLWKGKEPSLITLMLKGSNFEHHGMWNEDDAGFVEKHLQSEDLTEKCLERISERLSKKSAGEIALLYSGKFLSQWSLGDCFGTYWATADTDLHNTIPFSNPFKAITDGVLAGTYLDTVSKDLPDTFPVPGPFQAIYAVLLILSLFALFSKKEHPTLALPLILLCGFGIVFMLLETQGRYSYIASWIFVILAACGFERLMTSEKYTQKVRQLYSKHKMSCNYIFFGIVTTAVNIVSYYLLYNIFRIPNITSTIIAWFLAVAVAYITNKSWVFESKSKTPEILTKEISMFFSCRLLTGILDVVIMWICVDLLVFNPILIKIISNLIVIILNYFASKLYIFKSNVSD